MNSKLLKNPLPSQKWKKPKVSVVIPCYNHASYLREAVESVLSQTLKDLEIVIVNDGSADNSQDVALQLIAEKPNENLILLNQPNSGLPTSRNNGIKAAHSDYIFVLDADDKIHPKALELLAEVLDKHENICLVYSDYRTFGDINVDAELPDFDPDGHLKRNRYVTGNCMFRRKVWEDVGGYNPNMKYGCEDWDFSIGVLEKGGGFYHIKQKLFFYRRSGITMVHTTHAYYPYLRSQIILNHPRMYSEEEVKKSCELISEYHKAEELGSKEHGPLVSIIISSYADKDKLKLSLESLQKQFYRDFEVIIFNNASPDIRDIIDELELKDKIGYINHGMKKNPGSSKNAAIKIAKGKYIAYLNENTIFYPQHIGTLVEYLEMSDCKIAYTDASKIIKTVVNGKLQMIDKTLAFDGDIDTKTIVLDNPVPLAGFMHTKEFLREVGLFDESPIAFDDWDFLIRASIKSIMAHIKKPTLEYTPKEALDIISLKAVIDYLRAANSICKRARNYLREETQIANDLTGWMPLFYKNIYSMLFLRIYRNMFFGVSNQHHAMELVGELIRHKKLILEFLGVNLFGGYLIPKAFAIAFLAKNSLLCRARIVLEMCRWRPNSRS